MSLDAIVGDAGIGHNLFLSPDTRYKRRDRQQGHDNQNDKAAQPDIFSPNEQGGQEQPGSNHRADDRKVIQQKV